MSTKKLADTTPLSGIQENIIIESTFTKGMDLILQISNINDHIYKYSWVIETC